MSEKMHGRMSLLGLAAIVIASPSIASAALVTTDPSIINLYRLNEQTSGQLVNSPLPGQFLDTAPTGTPQNHDDLNANGPTWGTGAAYEQASVPVGDGIGLGFNRSNTEYTRFQAWMGTPQGNYTNGKSFSMMIRVKPGTLVDNETYDLIGNGSHGITLRGNSTPGTASVNFRLRDQNTFWTLNGSGGSVDPASTGGGSMGANFIANSGTWANLFLIYDANVTPALSRLTVAIDDGSFKAQTSIGAPTGFDTIAEGFDNAGVAWFVGSAGSATNDYDGLIESIVFWDKALTNEQASAIGLTNGEVPEPAMGSLLLVAGGLAMRRRGR